VKTLGQTGFTDIGELLLDSKKRFSWTCVQTAGEEVAFLINASQSAYTVSWAYCVRHANCKFVNFFWKLQPLKPFHGHLHVHHPKIYNGKHGSSPKQEINQNLLYTTIAVFQILSLNSSMG
jgi:hypothetical protein